MAHLSLVLVGFAMCFGNSGFLCCSLVRTGRKAIRARDSLGRWPPLSPGHQPNRSWGDSVSLGEVGEPLALLQTSVPRPLHGQQRGTGLLPIAVIETTIKMLSREEFLSSYASRKQSIT